MVKIFTALPSYHRLYYHIQNFWSSDDTVLSPLQVSRRSTYSAILNHINCLSGVSPLTLTAISAIHEAGGDQTADVMSAIKTYDAPATVASAAPLYIKFAHWVLVQCWKEGFRSWKTKVDIM